MTLRPTTEDKPISKGIEHQQNVGNRVANSGQPEDATTKTTQGKTAGTTGASVLATTAVPAADGTASATRLGSNAHSQGEGENSHEPDAGKGQAPNASAVGGAAAAASGSPASAPTAANHSATPNSAAAAPNAAGGTATSPLHPATSERGGTGPADFTPATIAVHRDAAPATGAENGVTAVRNAQLVGRASQAEMRIQMQTDTLGPLELRTWATGNRVAATITAARPDTHWLLSNAVPTLHQALSDHNLQVERIDIVWNGAGNAGNSPGSSSGGNSGSNGGAPNRRVTSESWSAAAPAEQSSLAAEEATTSSAAGLYGEGRLSVRV